ncbi:MAG: hypothetical protein IKW53_07510 [Clostridia bacterium]|nr:hypothetical protein [Clostridia bacterium]
MKNTSSKNIINVFGAWIKERVRKFFVVLKKNPQSIPLVALLVAFLQFSLNLTYISNTTSKLVSSRMEGTNAGLAAFITMLLTILSFVCMLNAFPKRQKPKVGMIVLMVIMYGAIILANLHYLSCISYALNTEINTNPIVISNETNYILTARDTLSLNIVLIGITIVLVLVEPIIAKLLKKINTSIEVESNGNIGNIDIAEEE